MDVPAHGQRVAVHSESCCAPESEFATVFGDLRQVLQRERILPPGRHQHD